MIGTIYKIVSKKDRNKIYIGSCWDFTRRKIDHKSKCYNEKNRHYNTPVYRYIRENGGWTEFEIYAIDGGNYESIREREQIEQTYINLYGGVENLLNSQNAVENKQQTREKTNIARDKCHKRNKETKRFYCEPCNTTCRSNWELNNHLLTDKHQLKLMESINIIKLPTYCITCKKHYPSHSALLRHYTSNKHENNLSKNVSS
tara:strand:- start:7056 stop:7661 length:606 start_codon:yes stop_codon:yes gene_type:complete